MHPSTYELNPFSLLVDPQAVLAAVERSGRLSRLTSRICRPLDRLSGPVATDDAALRDAAQTDHGADIDADAYTDERDLPGA